MRNVTITFLNPRYPQSKHTLRDSSHPLLLSVSLACYAMFSKFIHKRIPLESLPTFSLINSSKVRTFTQGVQVVDDDEPRDTLCSRVESLRRGEPVIAAFQSWMGEGFSIHRGDIFHANNRLRKLKKNKRALEAMEWVMRERPYKVKELDYSYLLEFTTKRHGASHGESLFLRVPHEHQNELLYNNLVISCLDQGKIRLSLDYMRKMRELSFPISYHVYNRLIELHSSSGRKKSIPKILKQMKADGVFAGKLETKEKIKESMNFINSLNELQSHLSVFPIYKREKESTKILPIV